MTSPGPDAGASSYPTPPYPVNSPPDIQPLYQAVDTLRSTHGSQQQQQTIIRSLQSCEFSSKNLSLTDVQIGQILKTEAHLLSRHPLGILQPLLDGDSNMSSLNKLGLPEEWEGIYGGANYLRVLDADKDKKNSFVLGPLARRIAQILCYLNYERLCMQGETDPIDPSRRNSAMITLAPIMYGGVSGGGGLQHCWDLVSYWSLRIS